MGNPSIFYRSTSFNSYSNRYDCTNTKQASSLFFCDSIPDDDKPQRYFLNSCFLCKTPIHLGDDIYMYRGDAPFCSEECRQQQIEIDDANDRNINMKKKEKRSNKSLDISSRSNTVQVRAATASVAG